MRKPVIKRFNGRWVCKTAYGEGHAFEQYNQLFLTQADTPRSAWQLWYKYTRSQALDLIHQFMDIPTFSKRLPLKRKTRALIEHDRYLAKVDG